MGNTFTLVKQFGNPTFSSLIVTGNTNLGDNLVVSGSITAQSLIVNTTSVYSGSTRFGDIITNTHQFTGSIFNSGSVTSLQFNGSGAGLTSIPNAALTNNTISGIALGSSLATLTIGTGLSGTSYNGSGAITIANTGVTSIVAGTGISINQGTGAVTVTNTITNNNQLTNGAGYITSAGNAATATALSSGQSNWSGTGVLGNVVGLLAWKNYGNNHVIFDASNSTSPSGGAVNNTNATNAWTGTYPTLMGWNGSGTYGVRVDSARVADSADSVAWTNVSSRPTALSQFSNDLGNYGGWITSAGTAAAVSQTVTGTNSAELVRGNMADNDQFRILIGAGASNAGYVEIATADDGNEPIHIRQYTGVFSNIARTATLLDGSGNTSFPGNISGAYILGSYFNASAGNSENPTIGQIWTQDTSDNYLRKSTPAHLISQLGLITTSNYSSYALPLSGGTISGNVIINGSTNTPLKITATEPYMEVQAIGSTNVCGVKLLPTTNYDAYIGNYGGSGKLWLIAGNADNAYVDSAGSLFNRTGTYGTISDITLKENIINATPKLQDLLKLKVRNFNFIGKNEKQLGFIAQEFEEVFPNAVNTDTGLGDMNGKKVVKTTVLIPMLVKAIQEQQTLITELQEKLERHNIT
jgi:hypothetical protein